MTYKHNPEFEKLLLGETEFWKLYLHRSGQHQFLGRSYAMAKRQEANDYTKMTLDERDELFDLVEPSWRESVRKVWGDFKPNISMFGNEFNHLHAHLIPRRSKPISYNSRIFTDPNPHGNYSPYDNSFKLHDIELIPIRDALKEALSFENPKSIV